MELSVHGKLICFQMSNETDMGSLGNSTVVSTTPVPVVSSTEIGITNTSHNGTITPQAPIFLQTPAAQGIGGAFAFAAILITVHQVGSPTHVLCYRCVVCNEWSCAVSQCLHTCVNLLCKRLC